MISFTGVLLNCFSVNSFHPEPRHVSPLYLGLQIDQAEHEGYSVFAVMSADEQSSEDLVPANLPPCQADDAVCLIAEETKLTRGLPLSEGLDRRSQAIMDDENIFTSSGQGPSLSSGFGNEDEELNRAIEASLQSQPSVPTQRVEPQPIFDDEDPELAAAIAASLATGSGETVEAGEDESMEETETQEQEEDKPMTAEDMRKARLARFSQ